LEEKKNESDEENENSQEHDNSDSEELSDAVPVDYPVPLAMWYFDQCDPKRCSGMILKRHGRLKTLPISAKFNGIVLTPTAKKTVTLEDAEIMSTFGVCVIDCSWAFFD
jgi:pre-rRNA-processing protein TSR3